MEPGDKIGYLTLLERKKKDKRAYWLCHCDLCGNEKEIREDSLKSGKQISDGCYNTSKERSEKAKLKHPIEDLTGMIFGDLTVTGLSDKRVGKKILWICNCSCGNTVEVWSANLKNGNTKTCGSLFHRQHHLEDLWKNTLDDLTGMRFGNWNVLERDGNFQPTRWFCQCVLCGTIRSVLSVNLKNGTSTGDGCERANESLVGQTVGHWQVLERSKRLRPNGRYCTTYLCVCDLCGTQRYVDESRLLNGTSLSCGCLKSKYNEIISKYLADNNIAFIPEYKFTDLIGPGGGLLRFDFAVLDNKGNLQYLIEYQGEQHYKECEFGREQREITDPMKREYCKKHNIMLYEIRYDSNIDEELDRITSTHITC